MWIGLACTVAAAPLYWAVVPARLRVPVATLASLAALGLWDLRIVALLAGCIGLLVLAGALQGASARVRSGVAVGGIAALVALFVANKTSGSQLAVLSTQGGIAVVGVSYLVLKTAALLVDRTRGAVRDARLAEIAAWLCFLPTYPSGPMEDFDHFRSQRPALDWGRIAGGLERIVFGLAKAVVASPLLWQLAEPVMADPAAASQLDRLLATYAMTLRFYLDFAGYSDIAIGLAALYGFDIEENFDHPLVRRNLVELWRHWHMTLTRFLRVYLFLPVSRRLLRWGGERADGLAIVGGQLVAMGFCGLWHGLGWNFLVWGLLHALGLVWVGLVARDLGRRLPAGWIRWWRKSPVAYVLSVLLTFHAFAAINVFGASDVRSAVAFLRLLFVP